MSETIHLYRGYHLAIERDASGAICITQGGLSLRLSELAFERMYDAFGEALAVLSMAEMGFPPPPPVHELAAR